MGWLVRMLGPLGWLVDPISKGVEAIAKYKGKALDAKTEQERMVWEAKADAAQNRLENLKSGERWRPVAVINALVRTAFALPFILFLWKAVAFDKVLFVGGTTDPLSDDIWAVFFAILLYFFGTSALDKFGGRR